ncbi:hypothetical protein OUZ56_011779 [Daphnia magna]|uniref:Uncharacterized protein n=1 Tax=Daphnia magna TaxID=35525 RepID=A0ABQ9Z141_9CRUS|nr:hypothetical protein OUZ56_011779 [Daphnia magna]
MKPEGERSGFPVERSEDPDPTNLVAKGPPIDTSLSRQPSDNGVEETNVSSEILDGDSRRETHHTGEEYEENGTAGVRTDGNFHDICETVSDLPLRTDLQDHRLKETHSNEKQELLCDTPECVDCGKRRKTTYLPPYFGSERVCPSIWKIYSTTPPTNVFGGNSQPCPIPKKHSVTYAIRTTDPGDKITSDKTGQLPSSHQTRQHIAEPSYTCQRTHVNRLITLYETMLWKTEHWPPLETPSEFENRFRKSMSTQTDDFSVNNSENESTEMKNEDSDTLTDTETPPSDYHFSDDKSNQHTLSQKHHTNQFLQSKEQDSSAETKSISPSRYSFTPTSKNNSTNNQNDSSKPKESNVDVSANANAHANAAGRSQRTRRKPSRYANGVQ